MRTYPRACWPALMPRIKPVRRPFASPARLSASAPHPFALCIEMIWLLQRGSWARQAWASERIREILKDHQDVRYAGFVDEAEQEYAEARNVYSIITRHEVPTPGRSGSGHCQLPVRPRRCHRGTPPAHTGPNPQRRPAEGEYFLEVIEEIYYLLMLFDYPDAITRGLRRKSDLARSMLEKTQRGPHQCPGDGQEQESQPTDMLK